MPLVYLGLGSNLGDRQAYLRQALSELQKCGAILKTSAIYETEPVGLKDQPWFLNCAVALQTDFDPSTLLEKTQAIEQAFGRQRTVCFGPRTIDIDILFYDNLVLETDTLTIPHPRLHERRFVLVPLAALAPTVVHPRLGKIIKTLLGECVDTCQVIKYGVLRERLTN